MDKVGITTMERETTKPQVGDLFRRGAELYSYYLIVEKDKNSWIGLKLDDGNKYRINLMFGSWKKIG